MNHHKHIGKTKKRENFYRTRYYEVMIDTKNQPFIPLYGLADDIKTTLLNLIHNSGEIPSDIYKPLDIKAGTFRAKITQLRQDGLIRRNFEDKVHTYLLTPAGRKRFKIIPPYIRTAADLKTRLRHIRLARLNACLEGLNVTTFLEMNPPLKNFANNQFAQDSLHFYNSYFLKPTVAKNSLGFRRSKAMGVLAGRDNAFMLYYSPEACDFYHEERLFSNFVCDYMNIRYDEMKMMIVVDTLYQASYWLHFLLSQSQYFDGDSPLDLFEKVQLLVLDRNAGESFELLYREVELAAAVMDEMKIQDRNMSNLSYNTINNGKKERFFFVFTLDIYHIRYIIATAEYETDKTVHIITTRYLSLVINALVKDTRIEIHFLNPGFVDAFI